MKLVEDLPLILLLFQVSVQVILLFVLLSYSLSPLYFFSSYMYVHSYSKLSYAHAYMYKKCLLSFKILSCLLDNASLLHVRSPHIFITSTKIQVFWELPPLFRPDGLIPAEISHYQLTYRPSTSAIVTPVLFSNNSLNYTLESLVPNTKYFITINVQYSKLVVWKGIL